MILPASRQYKVYNSSGKELDAKCFINYQELHGKDTKELIVGFEQPRMFITIDIPRQLIGIPERSDRMIMIDDILIFDRRSLYFTTINAGFAKLINHYWIDDNLIAFETFSRLVRLGDEIVIRRVEQGFL